MELMQPLAQAQTPATSRTPAAPDKIIIVGADGKSQTIELHQTVRGLEVASPDVAAALSEGEDARTGVGDNFDDGVMVGGFSVLLFMSLVLLAARRRWKRPGSGRFPQAGTDSAQRLERLEQGVDAIAIEIERVSEGQRFVTRLLSEQQAMPAATAASSLSRARQE
jgi:hypothetical protein